MSVQNFVPRVVETHQWWADRQTDRQTNIPIPRAMLKHVYFPQTKVGKKCQTVSGPDDHKQKTLTPSSRSTVLSLCKDTMQQHPTNH